MVLDNKHKQLYKCYMINENRPNPDFLAQLGALALGSRLKRLSESMMADASQVYRHFGMDVQPRWFPLMALLHERDQVTVVEAAEAIRVSQPAVSQFIRQLQQAKLVRVVACEDDGRRRLLSLTRIGREAVETMQPMWRAVNQAAEQLCADTGFDVLSVLGGLERALSEKSLLSRTLEVHDAQG